MVSIFVIRSCLLLIAPILIFSCQDNLLTNKSNSTIEEGFDNDEGPLVFWNFSNASDYIFDSNYIDVTGGRAILKGVDQTHSGNDFNSGIHVGTYVDESNNITLLTKPSSNATHVNTILPSKSSNLVGYWRFDGNISDSTGNSSGVANGDFAVTGEAKLGSGSAILDGDSDYLQVATPTSLQPSKVTFSMWIKLSSIAPSIQLFGGYGNTSNSGYFLFYEASQFKFFASDGTVSGSAAHVYSGEAPSTGEWVHLVGTYEAGEAKIYVNGEYKARNTLTSGPLNYSGLSQGFLLGNIGGLASTRYFNGIMDEVAVWDDVLSALEIQTLYESQNASFTELSPSWTPKWDNLVGYWKMDGNWQDSSGNENHGSINSGAPSFSNSSAVGSMSGEFFSNAEIDRVWIPDSNELDISNSLTVTAWMYYGTTSSVNINLITKANNTGDANFVSYYGGVNNTVIFYANAGGSWKNITSLGQIKANQWYFITLTYNSTDGGLLYINGEKVGSRRGPGTLSTNTAPLILGEGFNSVDVDAKIDDLSIWNIELTQADIKTIYNRQKQKYAGHYNSPVIDLGTSGSWTNLDAITPLPFGKEIVAQASESSSDYSSLSGDLSNGAELYYNLNETSLNSVSGADFADKSGFSRHGDESGGVIPGEQGVLNFGAFFDGINDYIISQSFNLSSGSEVTISAWMKTSDISDFPGPIHLRSAAEGPIFELFVYTDGSLRGLINHDYISVGWDASVSSTDTYSDWNSWHHVALVFSSNEMRLYRDGEQVGVKTSIPGNLDTVNNVLWVGKKSNNDLFPGFIDEAALWSRALIATEIQQLYRRGANRIKYQVKSCLDPTCNCKSYNTAPVGSASDCDGDGTDNSSDTDDTYVAEFIGPGGSGTTYYSELFNRNPSDLTFNCTLNTSDSDNNICMNDEITLGGDTNETSPNFIFSDMASSAALSDNPYFQYRVIMEAEDNTTCSSGTETCLPKLTSVEVAPAGRYYGGNPDVVTKSGQRFLSWTGFSATSSGSCTPTYQVSLDKSTWYYHNGTTWMAAASANDSSIASVLNANASSFASVVGTGTLFFKVFLNSNTSQDCSVSSITARVVR